MDRINKAVTFVTSRKATIVRYVVAFPLVLPGAGLLSVAALTVPMVMGYYAVGSSAFVPPLTIKQVLAIALACWIVLTYWAASTDSSKRTAIRACWAFSTGSFLFPVMVFMIFALDPPNPPDESTALIPNWVFDLVVFCLTVIYGLLIGLISRFVAKETAPVGSPEKSGGIWYVFKPIGGRYLVLAVGLLFIGALLPAPKSTPGISQLTF